MNSNILTLTGAQLRRAADIKEEIGKLEEKFRSVFSPELESSQVIIKRRRMPRAARLKIAASARLRPGRKRRLLVATVSETFFNQSRKGEL